MTGLYKSLTSPPICMRYEYKNNNTYYLICICVKNCQLTEDLGNEAQRKLRGEDGEEPGGSEERGSHLVLVQMYVEVGMIVVDQPRQLVQLHLQHHHVGQVLSSHVMAEHQVTYHQERLFFTHLLGNKKYL